MCSSSCLLFILNLLPIFVNAAEGPKVCLPELGCVQGTHMPGYQTDTFEAFMGIPYAKPPVGPLRFKNPEAATAWQDVLQATEPKSECLQKNYLLRDWPVYGEEDCLYLNLYRPLQRSSDSLPVIVYIHGGGFFSGSGNPKFVGPEYFMDTQAVIFVAFTYRLGPFGFLSTGDEHIPGNFGLKDQNLALKWVHANVAAFGGDPHAVTLFGHSAGGSAAQFHMLSEASKGLFQRSIQMSGSAVAPFVAIVTQPLQQAVELAQAAGFSNAATLSRMDLAETLRTMDGVKLLNAGDAFKAWHTIPLINFRPTIEQESWQGAFLTAHPAALLESGKFTRVPCLMGVVPSRGEGKVLTLSMSQSEQLKQQFNQDFDKLLQHIVDVPKDALQLLIDEYFQGQHELNNSTMDGFAELFGDYAFYYPLYKSIDYHLHGGTVEQSPVYLFKFNYRGPQSFSMIFSGGKLENFGVVHIDDMLYSFHMPFLFDDYLKQSTDAELVKAYVNFLVQFAGTGEPQSAQHLEPCSAEKFHSSGDDGICNYLEFNNEGNTFKEVLINEFNVKRMQFWDRILANRH